jgi:hypothetical protein
MPASLLNLPYELREQILGAVLYHEDCIKLQYPAENPGVFTPAVTQVCKILRDEAVRVFYHINSFVWTIDPEAVRSVTETLACMHHFCLTLATIARAYRSNKLSFTWLATQRQALQCTINFAIYASLAFSGRHATPSSLKAQLIPPKPLQYKAVGGSIIRAAHQIRPSHRQWRKIERSEDLHRNLVPFSQYHYPANRNSRYS